MANFEVEVVEVHTQYITKKVLITNAKDLEDAENLALIGEYDQQLGEVDITDSEVIDSYIESAKEIV